MTSPKAPASKTEPHVWRFFRAGGVDQVRLDTGADILNLAQLDQKLWVALSCPVKGLELDERTLALLDTDNDGRVRVPEILAAVQWIGSVLKNADDLVKPQDGVPLAAIDATRQNGKLVLASAKRVLQEIGKDNVNFITVDDSMKSGEVLIKAKWNGDGIVPPSSVDDPVAKQVAVELLECLGGVSDRSGQLGYDQAKLDQFFADLTAFDAWHQQAERAVAKVLPLGEQTAVAFAAIESVRTKVHDYFGRCRLAAFDVRAQAALNREEAAYLDIAAKDLSITAVEVNGFPLAQVAPKQPLPLTDGVNPAWHDAIAKLRTAAIDPLLGKGKTSLTEAEWSELTGRLAGYQDWFANRAGTTVEKLGLKRVRAILTSNAKATLEQAIAADRAVDAEIQGIAQVERLTRYYRDLHSLLRNFVSFTDFYARKKAMFQAGRLYVDGRSCDLVVRVDDPAKHGQLAVMAKTYLTYCDCTRPGNDKITVAAAMTAGDSDYLFVGRNAVFYDRKGRDWDATITKIIDNPISIGQAFLAPYKRVLRWIEEQVAKRAAAADSAAEDKLKAVAAATGDATKGTQPKPKFDIGIVAAMGVAFAGITTAVGVLLNAFFGLGKWMPLGIVGLVVLISGPSMLIAWLKLRQRNLGPILDANGWAVNGRVKVNIPLGAALTDRATLPIGAQRSLTDPYAEKRSPWPRILLVLALLGAVWYGLHRTRILHNNWPWYQQTSERWLGKDEPATVAPPAGKPADNEAPK